MSADHKFTEKISKWAFCAKCGLILLKTKATERARAMKCTGKDE